MKRCNHRDPSSGLPEDTADWPNYPMHRDDRCYRWRWHWGTHRYRPWTRIFF